MCQCPEALPPPNDQIKKCRIILQGLAAGLLIISILSIMAENIFGLLMYLLLIYLLFMSWTQFNWCLTLVFFLFCVTDFIQSTILLIGMIQYGQLFQGKYVFLSLYVLMSFFYFSAAIYFSHYAYRHFKAMNQDGLLNPLNMGGPVNPNQGLQENDAVYRRVQEPPNNRNNVFQGQGVRIG